MLIRYYELFESGMLKSASKGRCSEEREYIIVCCHTSLYAGGIIALGKNHCIYPGPLSYWLYMTTRSLTSLKELRWKSHGFTLIELLIVISIIGLLLVLVLVNWKRQIDRANDSHRKTDLAKIKRAFEEYYNDHQCYPALNILSFCGSTNTPFGDPPGLAPYLREIPCDPVIKNQPYKYVPVDDANLCKGYRAFATLFDTGDIDITGLGCHPLYGCGFGAKYNYGISSGVPVADPNFNPNITPTPTPGASSGQYACSPGPLSSCKSYGNPGAAGCLVTYSDPSCLINGVYQCPTPGNWCQNY